MADVQIKATEPVFSDVDPDLRTDHQGNILILRDERALNAAVQNILEIAPGEMLRDRYFGGDLKNMVARNVDNSTAAFIRMAIAHSIDQDPRIKLDTLSVVPRADEGQFEVLLKFSDNEGYIRGQFQAVLER
jgi:phage baseplate assembly protein W